MITKEKDNVFNLLKDNKPLHIRWYINLKQILLTKMHYLKK